MLANLLRLVDEMAGDEPGAVPDDSELLTAPDESRPKTLTASAHPPTEPPDASAADRGPATRLARGTQN